jgi:BASS family bile acid:Na+ symporter
LKDIAMTLLALAHQAFVGAVFALMVGIGLRTRPADALHLMRHWAKGARAFAALFLIVPAAVILVALILPIPPAVEVALIAIAVSPMLPMLPNDLAKMGADHAYCVSLEVVGVVMALAAVPVVFWVVAHIAGVEINIATLPLLTSLALGVLLPLAIGGAVALIVPAYSLRLAKTITTVATAVLIVSVLGILWGRRELLMAQLGGWTLLAIVLLVGVGLAVGHALGGPRRQDRIALAMTAASRHVGFALAVGASVAPNSVPTVAGVILVYFVVRGLLVLPYVRTVGPGAPIADGPR